MAAPRIIKKYPNRRLYDTETSAYITLAEVKDLVLQYKDFQVLDAKTGEDLTRAILLQIILEEESGGVPMFSSSMLANIIRYYGHAMQGLMDKIMNASKGKPEPRIVSPAGVWGFAVDKDAKDEDPGVTVKEVLAGGAAAAGGLKAGDRLLTLDGRWTDSVADTFAAASLVKPGRSVAVVVKRDGKEVKLTVKPAKGV